MAITWFRKLQNRLVVYMVLGALLPVLILGYSSYQISLDGLNAQANELTQTILHREIRNLENFVRAARRLANNTAQSETIQTVIAAVESSEGITNLERLRLRSSIEDELASMFSIQGLIGIDLIVGTDLFSIGDFTADMEYDHSLVLQWLDRCGDFTGTLCWPGIELNPLTGSRYGFVIPAVIQVTRFNENSLQYDRVGMLILKYDVDTVYEEFFNDSDGNMYNIVLDSIGRTVYHPHQSKLRSQFQGVDLPQAAGVAKPVDAVVDEKQVRLLVKTISPMNWYVLGVIELEPILTRARNIRLYTYGLFLFAMFLLAVAVYYLSRKVVAPIEAITNAAKHLGQLSAPLESNTSIIEINQLEHWFNVYRTVVDREKIHQEELQQAYENLQQTQQQLVESEKLAALGGLVAGVAHEINTPLGVAITANSILVERTPEIEKKLKSGAITVSDLEDFLDQCKEVTGILQFNLGRAAELVSTFKRTAANQVQDHLTDIELVAYIEEILSSLKVAMKEYAVTVNVTGDSSIRIQSYPGLLWQIISNLVMNSLYHGFEKDKPATISVDVSVVAEKIEIVYRDDGKGISQDILANIFDPFFTTRRGQGSTGLGLSIIYNLVVQRLKGNVYCTSKLGEGVTFKIRMPKALQE